MQLDDWILCRVYQKSDKSTKDSALISENPQEVVNDEFGEMDNYYEYLMVDQNPTLLLDNNIWDYYDESLMGNGMVEEGTMDGVDKKPDADDDNKHNNV